MVETAAINDHCNMVPEFPMYECPRNLHSAKLFLEHGVDVKIEKQPVNTQI